MGKSRASLQVSPEVEINADELYISLGLHN